MTKGFRAALDCACSGARATGVRQPALRLSLHEQRRAVRWHPQRVIPRRAAQAALLALANLPSGHEGNHYSI
jgi:hypothetical protein